MGTEVARKFGGWRTATTNPEVLWWSGIPDVPEPVMAFLDCLLHHFDNMEKAFRRIDGPGGNGEVSLSEFKDAIDEFDWRQFKDSPELATQVFRYLDPDNGG